MIIDAHAHACGLYLNEKKIIEILDASNVDKVVLVPGEFGSDKNYRMPDFGSKFPNTDIVAFVNILIKIIIRISGAADQIDAGNKFVASLAKNHPDRIIQFYWARLSQANALETLARDYAEFKFKGLKLHQCWEPFDIRSEIFTEVADWAYSKDLPIFIHLFSKNQATQLAEFINTRSKTTFIIAHLFGLERYIQAKVNSDNCYFEISSPQLVSIKRLNIALKHFGAKRIILGSDIPYGWNNLNLNIERVNNLQISNQEKNLILGDNMKTLLKITT